MMQTIEEEWSRLTKLYSEMSEGELQKLANEAYELTDAARDVLRGEISRRGLQIQLLDQPASREIAPPHERADGFDPAGLDLVPVDRAYDLADARRLKGILDDAGLPSYFGPDNLENAERLKASFDAAEAEARKRGFEVGIELKVPSRYLQIASRAIGQASREAEKDPNPNDEADYLAVCPSCHSPEIVFQGLDENEDQIPIQNSTGPAMRVVINGRMTASSKKEMWQAKSGEL